MATSNVTGFPAYIKVIDASQQDTDKNLSFVDKETRIKESALRLSAVSAEDYVATAQTKLEEQKKAILDENDLLKAQQLALAQEKAKLEAERNAALAELAALKAVAEKAKEDTKKTTK